MKYINEDMVRDLLSPDRAIEAVEKAFADFSHGLIRTGVRGTLNVDPSGDDCIFLPAVHGRELFYSLKCAASFPRCAAKGLPTVQSQILIFSKETGTLAAIIEANWLTALKTGAADLIVADSKAAALEFAGDLVVLIRQGRFPEDPDIPELGDIVAGKAKGRSGPDQIILYESVGFPPLDLAVGIEVFRLARDI